MTDLLPGLLAAREIWRTKGDLFPLELDAAIATARQSGEGRAELTPDEVLEVLEASEKGVHRWFTYRAGWPETCEFCGIVRRADDKNSPCKGVVKVGLRASPPPPANERLAGVEDALKRLANEVAGLEAFETRVREAIGDTNYGCIQYRLAEAREALRSRQDVGGFGEVLATLPEPRIIESIRAQLKNLPYYGWNAKVELRGADAKAVLDFLDAALTSPGKGNGK